MIIGMFLAGSVMLLVGLGVTAFFTPRTLRELRSMKDAEALREWKSTPLETRTAVRTAWRRGLVVANPDDARVAVAMSEHVDRVLAATNRVSWWACAPLAPGLVLIVASLGLPRVLWPIVLIPPVLWVAFRPMAARSQKRRHRSIRLTKERHAA
jgi:hypothetical protein